MLYIGRKFLRKEFLMLDSSLAKSELSWDNSSDINQDLFSIISGYKLILESPEDVLEYCKSEIMQRITSILLCLIIHLIPSNLLREKEILRLVREYVSDNLIKKNSKVTHQDRIPVSEK